MPTTIKLLPPTDNLAAEAAPILEQMNQEDAFNDTGRISTYTLNILHRRTHGQMRLPVALALERHILTETGQRSLGPIWTALAAIEVLGQVQTLTLTEPCLYRLLVAALGLHSLVFMPPLSTLKNLTDAAAARKTSIRAICGLPVEPYLSYIDRIVERLAPLLPR